MAELNWYMKNTYSPGATIVNGELSEEVNLNHQTLWHLCCDDLKEDTSGEEPRKGRFSVSAVVEEGGVLSEIYFTAASSLFPTTLENVDFTLSEVLGGSSALILIIDEDEEYDTCIFEFTATRFGAENFEFLNSGNITIKDNYGRTISEPKVNTLKYYAYFGLLVKGKNMTSLDSIGSDNKFKLKSSDTKYDLYKKISGDNVYFNSEELNTWTTTNTEGTSGLAIETDQGDYVTVSAQIKFTITSTRTDSSETAVVSCNTGTLTVNFGADQGKISVYKYDYPEWTISSDNDVIYGNEKAIITASSDIPNATNTVAYKKSEETEYTPLGSLSPDSRSVGFRQPSIPSGSDAIIYLFKISTSGTTYYYPYVKSISETIMGCDRQTVTFIPKAGYEINIKRENVGKDKGIQVKFSANLDYPITSVDVTISKGESSADNIHAEWIKASSTVIFYIDNEEDDKMEAVFDITFPETDAHKSAKISNFIIKRVNGLVPGWKIEPPEKAIEVKDTTTLTIKDIPTDGNYTVDDFTISIPDCSISNKTLSESTLTATITNTDGRSGYNPVLITVQSSEKTTSDKRYIAKTDYSSIFINKWSNNFLFQNIPTYVNINRPTDVSVWFDNAVNRCPEGPIHDYAMFEGQGWWESPFYLSIWHDKTVYLTSYNGRVKNSDAGRKVIFEAYAAGNNYYERSDTTKCYVYLKGWQGETLATKYLEDGLVNYSFKMSQQAGNPSPQGNITSISLSPSPAAEDPEIQVTYSGDNIYITTKFDESITVTTDRAYTLTVQMSGNDRYNAGTWTIPIIVRCYRGMKVYDINSLSWKTIMPYAYQTVPSEGGGTENKWVRCKAITWNGSYWDTISS